MTSQAIYFSGIRGLLVLLSMWYGDETVVVASSPQFTPPQAEAVVPWPPHRDRSCTVAYAQAYACSLFPDSVPFVPRI